LNESILKKERILFHQYYHLAHFLTESHSTKAQTRDPEKKKKTLNIKTCFFFGFIDKKKNNKKIVVFGV